MRNRKSIYRDLIWQHKNDKNLETFISAKSTALFPEDIQNVYKKIQRFFENWPTKQP